MLAPGTYKGTIVSHRWTTSQANTPGLAVRVGIVTDFGDTEEYVGTVWMTDKAMGMSRMQFRALGFDPDTEDIGEIGQSISLVDNEVDVTLKEETYKGQTSVRVARFGREAPPPTKAALMAAQAKLRAAKKKTDVEPSPSAPAAKPQRIDPTPPAKTTQEDMAKLNNDFDKAMVEEESGEDGIPF